MVYPALRLFRSGFWGSLAALVVASPSAAAMQAEAPIYVIASTSSTHAGLAQITGYLDGAAPTLTYLFDLPAASQGQVFSASGIAWDSSAQRPVLSSFDGFSQSFSAVDLGTQTISLLFDDDLPVQMQGFAIGPNSIGYGQHIVSSDVLEIDLELEDVRAVGDFGAQTGSALAISPDGAVYALDQGTVLRRFDPATQQTTVIGETFLWGI